MTMTPTDGHALNPADGPQLTDTFDFRRPSTDGTGPEVGTTTIQRLKLLLGAEVTGTYTDEQAVFAVASAIDNGPGIQVNYANGRMTITNTLPVTRAAIKTMLLDILSGSSSVAITDNGDDLVLTSSGSGTGGGYPGDPYIQSMIDTESAAERTITDTEISNAIASATTSINTARDVAIATAIAGVVQYPGDQYILDLVDGVVEPPPPPSTRIDESFEFGTDAEQMTELTTSADTHAGAGSLFHSSTWSLDASLSALVDGTAQDYVTFTRPLAPTFKDRYYYRHGNTGSDTWWPFVYYGQDGTTVACRIGITVAGELTVQRGLAGATDVANFTFVADTLYRFDIEWSAALNSVIVRIYHGTRINSTVVGEAADQLQVSTTATHVGNVAFGMTVAIAGAGTIVAPNRTNETFNGAAGAVTTSNTSFTSVTAGTMLTLVAGGRDGNELRIHQGAGVVDSQIGRWTYTTVDGKRGVRLYVRADALPVGGSAYIFQVRNETDAAPAFQFGITTGGQFRVRNGTTGGTNLEANSTTVATVGVRYRIDIEATGAGQLRFRIFSGDSTTTANPIETVTMTNPLTATGFMSEQVGLLAVNAITSLDIRVDHVGSYGAAAADPLLVPSPFGATGVQAPKAHFARLRSNVDEYEPIYTIITGGGVSAKLVPPATYMWLGAATAPPPTGKGITQEGYDTWRNTIQGGIRPHIVHFFEKNSWPGPTLAQRRICEPEGGERSMMFFNWKLGQAAGYTMAQIAGGAADDQLLNACNGIKANMPYKFFLTFWHEFDNETTAEGTGNSASNFALMFRHCVQFFRDQGLGDQVIFCWLVTGGSDNANRQGGSNGANLNRMWPGDAFVDWVIWDPYMRSYSGGAFSRKTYAALMNENFSNATGWTGFYNWATTPKTVGIDGLAYAFGGSKPNGIGETGLDFGPNGVHGGTGDTFSDANAAEVFDQFPTEWDEYEQCKMYLYWNSSVDDAVLSNRIQGVGTVASQHPLAIAAWRRLAASRRVSYSTSNLTG